MTNSNPVMPVETAETVATAETIAPPPLEPSFVDRYIQERVDQYAGWYDRKAGPLKTRYLYLRALIVVGGALVPVLVNLAPPFASVAATIVSLMVVILVSWDTVFQYGKQWKNYRSTEQFLRQEAVLFKYRVGFYAPLDDDQAFRIFVERIENAIAQENAVTLDTLTRESQAGQSGSKGT
jgi:hypothetical protein